MEGLPLWSLLITAGGLIATVYGLAEARIRWKTSRQEARIDRVEGQFNAAIAKFAEDLLTLERQANDKFVRREDVLRMEKRLEDRLADLKGSLDQIFNWLREQNN